MSTKEYRTVSEARGGLLVTQGTAGVAFGDRVEILDHAGIKRNGQVIRCAEGEALILVFEGTDDLDLDSTWIRFLDQPVEIALSMAIKMAMILILGAPAVAVVIFEVLLNATAMFNHGNVKLPQALDRALRLVVVTPDFHRVHHSVYRNETDSNYGFNLSVWDRLFRTYRPQPRDGHETMTIGLDIFRDPRERYLDKLLIQPFVEDRRRDAVASE